MKRHIVILTLVLVTLTAVAGKNEATTQGVSLTDKRKAEYIYMEAQNQKLAGNYDAFHDLLVHAHEIDPSNTAISFYLGMCKLKMHNTNESL